jgi:hypothetical protein
MTPLSFLSFSIYLRPLLHSPLHTHTLCSHNSLTTLTPLRSHLFSCFAYLLYSHTRYSGGRFSRSKSLHHTVTPPPPGARLTLCVRVDDLSNVHINDISDDDYSTRDRVTIPSLPPSLLDHLFPAYLWNGWRFLRCGFHLSPWMLEVPLFFLPRSADRLVLRSRGRCLGSVKFIGVE